MEALEIKTIFTLTLFGLKIPFTETVIISWAVMLFLIIAALLLTRNLKEVPSGLQAILEMAVDFLNNLTKKQFGSWAKFLGPYLGTLFLFLLVSNLAGVLTPIGFKVFGFEFTAPFEITPPTKDISVTVAFACISIFLVLLCGLVSRGPLGWLKQLLHPLAFMLPFNLMDYATRLLSLSLRLFGNILGGYVLMSMIQKLMPIGLPTILSLYFDFFDGLIQAAIFVFLTGIYISEAVPKTEEL
ncbi:ATP synthase subunit a [Spirochaetia bacterium]|nr:ATP synthase subunit a [Spirochaetia bacterium]